MSRIPELMLVDDHGGRWYVCDTAPVQGRELALTLGGRRARRRLFVPLIGRPRAYVFGPRESRRTGRSRLLRQLAASAELADASLDAALIEAIVCV